MSALPWRRRLSVLLNSMPLLRVVMAAVIGWHAYLFATNDGMGRWVSPLLIVFMLGAWFLVEKRRRASEATRWMVAANNPDPLLFLARSEFNRTLTLRESKTLALWHLDHLSEHGGREPAPEEIAEAPSVVRDYYAVGTNPPREAL